MPKVEWVIPCPQCGKELRVNNYKLLGCRGQCPTCRHKFILEVPKAEGFHPRRANEPTDMASGQNGESGQNLMTAHPGETLKFDSGFDITLEDDEE